jgi:hypothetical protein
VTSKLLATARLVLLVACLFRACFAQVIISEFMASNTRTLADEDGEYSDWIELYNPADSPVNLEGWSLTDSSLNLQKWRFPAVTIGSGETFLVFASSKDRHIPGAPLHTNFKLSTGDYLALVDASGKVAFDFGPSIPVQAPDVSFGIAVEKRDLVLAPTNAPIRFIVPIDASADAIWSLSEFDDTTWTPATNGLGFDQAGLGYNSVIASDLTSAMKGANSTIYLRIPFQSPGQLNSLTLRVLYDDGFVAFLNGVPIAQANAPDELSWNSAAIAEHSGPAALNTEEFDLSDQSGLLHPGDNILAIQGLNASKDDNHFLLRAELVGTYSVLQTNLWRYFFQPTPNAVNGVGDTNIGPLILNASFTPARPLEGEPITVTAKMQQTFNPPATLTLTYLVMFGAETNLIMFDDGLHGDGAAGDGIYGTTIPPVATAGQMIRWSLRATDDQGLTSRWPPYRDPKNSPQYLGTVLADPTLTNQLPVLQWFLKSTSAADNTSGTRCSVFWKGVLYDNVFVNVHGQSSLSFPKKSYNLNFNTGYHFHYADSASPIGKVNLLTTYPDKAHVRNILAYETFRDAGHGYHFVVPIRIQRNAAFFADAHMVEDGDGDFLSRIGLDPNGALYKMYNTLNSSTSGVEKKTRAFEKNTDLQALIRGLATGGTNRAAFIYDNVNIPAMVNYAAALTMTGNVDCCHKNYYLYRDSLGTGEWHMLPWDMDLSFGRDWTGDYFDDRMYPQNELTPGSNNALLSALYALPEFKQMYYRRMQSLMDALLQPPGTPVSDLKYEHRMDELLSLIGPDAALDFAKWPTWGKKQTMPQAIDILKTNYLAQRRTFLYTTERALIPARITNQLTIDFAGIDFNPISSSQAEEYVCLTNSNPLAVDLSGWHLLGGITHTFAAGTVLPAHGSIYLSPNPAAFRQRATAPHGTQRLLVQGSYHGQLSARGETLTLRDTQDRVVQTFTYPGEPTLAQQFLRIVEIMYAPPENEDREYIVLKNIGPAPLNLNGVHFTNGIIFSVTNDLVLQSGQRLYLARNPVAFSNYYQISVLLAGPYLGQLANEGEPLQLDDAVGEKVLGFSYDNKWYTSTAAGAGHSLVLADDQTHYAAFSDKTSWLPSALAGGSVGAFNEWPNWRAQHFTAAQLADPIISGPNADPDNDGASNYSEFIAGTDPLSTSNHLSLALGGTVTAGLLLRMEAAPGRLYSISRASTLDAPLWNRVQTLPRSAKPGPVEFSLDNASQSTAAFYRVQVEL